MSKILFIDDDRYFARLYREALEKKFGTRNVIVCYDAKSAVKHIKTTPAIVAAVVDVMMPPPAQHKDECHDGNTTGVWIIRQCIDEIITNKIAILFFTNLAVQYVREEVLLYLELNEDLVDFRSKASVRSDDLPMFVEKLLSHR